ncbi:hypothetical protein [Ferrimonas senticii]|uniref:hypothetical protein n=1 Tax=Ferrimonas senticii TaxID=394566 RepID=UPI00040A84A0|nr:hypothetical protein [Ferrimonas senticii]
MIKNPLTVVTLTTLLGGCAGANVTNQMRDYQNAGMQTRCVSLSTSNSMNEELEQFDGWSLAYVSEYTTGNKVNTAAVMCFEKPVDANK